MTDQISEQTPEQQRSESFGWYVRFHRRQSTDPMRGGMLTQDRLGELIGRHMGDAGYTGAAVSEWERGKSKIHADDRLVLLALLGVLVECGGLAAPDEADRLLAAGNYRRLDESEFEILFPDAAHSIVQRYVKGHAEAAVHDPAPSRRDRQLVLLEKVHNFWVEGVLNKSVQGRPLIAIPRSYRNDAIDHPWAEYLGEGLISDTDPLDATTILQTFHQMDGALLILGYPGSGKTTTLITLADALLAEARTDWRQAVPVILDLASWARLQTDLASWVMEELTAKYQIPGRYGRKWIAANELILLLDGLDSLALPARRACIDAINAFRASHGLTGVAVCCRTEEYEETGKRLLLNGAIEMQPLDDSLLADYLAEEPAFDTLKEAVLSSPDLWQMAHNPLMLNIMTAVYAGQGKSEVQPIGIAAGTPAMEILFDAYMRRSFALHAAHEQYDRTFVMERLSWLAARMNEHSQSIFLIEQIQPSWLPGRRWRRAYMLLSGLITGFAGGIIMWLLWRLLRYTLPQLPAPTSETVARLLNTSLDMSEPFTIILGNLVLGLLLGGILLYLFERRMSAPIDKRSVRRQRWLQVILAGVVCGAATTLFVAFFADPLLAAAWGVAEGFMYAAAARFVFGWNYQSEVRTVEALGWSWKHAATGVLVGLTLALIAELIESRLYGYNGAARTIATLVVAGFVLGGLRGRSTEAKSRPNQGVWLSLRNALVAALVLSLTLAVLAWIIRDPVYAWQIGLLAAVIGAALMGASVFIKHFLLRAMLRYIGVVPWRYARFLDYVSHLVLMRKVGNGYIFMHGLLQDYLAAQIDGERGAG